MWELLGSFLPLHFGIEGNGNAPLHLLAGLTGSDVQRVIVSEYHPKTIPFTKTPLLVHVPFGLRGGGVGHLLLAPLLVRAGGEVLVAGAHAYCVGG